jgi:hypothetical protein
MTDECAGCNEFVDMLIHLLSRTNSNKVVIQSASAMVASGTDRIPDSQIFVVQGTVSLQDIHACLWVWLLPIHLSADTQLIRIQTCSRTVRFGVFVTRCLGLTMYFQLRWYRRVHHNCCHQLRSTRLPVSHRCLLFAQFRDFPGNIGRLLRYRKCRLHTS